MAALKTRELRKILITSAAAIGLAMTLPACSTVKKVIPGGGNSASKDGLTGGVKLRSEPVAPRMGVNEYLWRASLETMNFMPLLEVDPFGGVIITDWYASPQAPDERFKANIYVLDSNLRADALKVSIFKQVRSASGWNDASVDADTARSIEDSILTRARELYIATVDNN